MFASLRRHRHRLVTRLGLVVASAWLVFAAVPCSALPLLDAAHGHAMPMPMPGTAPACPHCPPSATADKSAGDCTGLDSAVVTKITTFDLTLAAPQALPTLAPVLDDSRVVAFTPRSNSPPTSVPLNLRYCTFIE